jgi:RHS repeat-associated protein
VALDAVGRLQSLQHNLAGTAHDTTVGFTYNPSGQIATRSQSNDAAYTWLPPTTSTTTLSTPVDGQNKLTHLNTAPVSHSLDGNVAAGISDQTYTYDIEGRLSGATGGISAVVEYDPTGMLAKVTAGGSATDYLYDGANLVAQYNGALLLRKFVHGAGIDAPVAWFEGSGTSIRKFLHADERGSVIAASDGAGAASVAVKYNLYGESGALASQFGYTGQLYIPALDLYYYKARMYSAKTGRFVQPDPIGYAGGMNLYAYVGGDPVNATDPLGLCTSYEFVRYGFTEWYEEDTGRVLDRRINYAIPDSLPGYCPASPMMDGNTSAVTTPPPQQDKKCIPTCDTALPNGRTIGAEVRSAVEDTLSFSNPLVFSNADYSVQMLAKIALYTFSFGPLDFKTRFRGQGNSVGLVAEDLSAAGNFAYGAYTAMFVGEDIGNLGAIGYATISNRLGIKADEFMAPNGMSKSGAEYIPLGYRTPGCYR